ncbi:MAG: hypothetical protein J6Q82_04160 [Clostridia bacterium]|nr:hypothetical protein [Clostridia bacterium]
MKKKLFFALLALLVCVSLLFVSCDKETVSEDTTAPATEENNDKKQEFDVEAGKAAVVKYIKADESVTADMDVESIMKNLKMTAEIDMSLMDETMELDMSMKDGLLYMNAVGEESYVLMQGDEALSFVKMPNGQWVLEEDEEEEDPAEDDETEWIMMLQGASFEDLTVEDIDYVDGKFVIKNDFLIEIFVDAIVDGVTDGEQIDSTEMDAAIAEAKGEFEKFIDAMNYEIFFRVSENEVTQAGFTMEMDSAAMQEFEFVEPGTSGRAKIEFSCKLADGGKTLKEASMKMELYEEGVTDMSMDFNFKMRSKTRLVLTGELTVWVQELGDSVTMDMEGTMMMNDDSGFPSTIPAIVQSYMK